MQERFVNNLIAGMTQYEAYKKAGYSAKSEKALMANSSKLIRIDKTKARLDYKRAEIEKKTEINIVSLRENLFKLGRKAEKAEKYNAAANCYVHLLKSIGGMTADAPNDKTLEAKRLEKGRAEALYRAITAEFERRYLSSKNSPSQGVTGGVKSIPEADVTVVDWQECPNKEAIKGDFSG
jgi:phage terminase small subunit